MVGIPVIMMPVFNDAHEPLHIDHFLELLERLHLGLVEAARQICAEVLQLHSLLLDEGETTILGVGELDELEVSCVAGDVDQHLQGISHHLGGGSGVVEDGLLSGELLEAIKGIPLHDFHAEPPSADLGRDALEVGRRCRGVVVRHLPRQKHRGGSLLDHGSDAAESTRIDAEIGALASEGMELREVGIYSTQLGHWHTPAGPRGLGQEIVAPNFISCGLTLSNNNLCAADKLRQVGRNGFLVELHEQACPHTSAWSHS